MRQFLRITLPVITAILLSACGIPMTPGLMIGTASQGILMASVMADALDSIPTETKVKTDELAAIRTIGLLEIPEPLPEDRETSIFCGARFGADLQGFVKQYLQEIGYEVIVVAANREKHRLIDDYRKIRADHVDAYLDIVPLIVSYEQESLLVSGNQLAPYHLVAARLVRASTNQVIYAGSLVYGKAIAPRMRWTGLIIEPLKGHKFASLDTFHANKEVAERRLWQGGEAVAWNLARILGKGEFQSVAQHAGEDYVIDGDSANSDLNGDYRANLRGGYQVRFAFTIEQDGQRITGASLNREWEIEGVRENDSIAFKWYGGGNKGKGKFTIDSCGNLFGEYAGDSWGQGEWILARTEYAFSADRIRVLQAEKPKRPEPNLEQAQDFNISGTYVSSLTGNIQPLGLKETEPRVTIVQDGASIRGTFGKREGKIWGDLAGDTIRFDWLSATGDSGKGLWTIDIEKNEINGTWGGRLGTGKWDLRKIE